MPDAVAERMGNPPASWAFRAQDLSHTSPNNLWLVVASSHDASGPDMFGRKKDSRKDPPFPEGVLLV